MHILSYLYYTFTRMHQWHVHTCTLGEGSVVQLGYYLHRYE